MPQCLISFANKVSNLHSDKWNEIVQSLKTKKFNEISFTSVNSGPDMKIEGPFDALELRFEKLSPRAQQCLLILDKIIWNRNDSAQSSWRDRVFGNQYPRNLVNESVISFFCAVSLFWKNSSSILPEQQNTSLQIIRELEEVHILQIGKFGTPLMKIPPIVLNWIQFKNEKESDNDVQNFHNRIRSAFTDTFCASFLPVSNFDEYWHQSSIQHVAFGSQNRQSDISPFWIRWFGRTQHLIEILLSLLPHSWTVQYDMSAQSSSLGNWNELGGFAPLLTYYVPGITSLNGLIFGTVEFSGLFVMVVIVCVLLKSWIDLSFVIQNELRSFLYHNIVYRIFFLIEIIWMWKAEYMSLNYFWFSFLVIKFIVGNQNSTINKMVVCLSFAPVLLFIGRAIWFRCWLNAIDIWEEYGFLELIVLCFPSSVSLLIIDACHSIPLALFSHIAVFKFVDPKYQRYLSFITYFYDIVWLIKWYQFWPARVVFIFRLAKHLYNFSELQQHETLLLLMSSIPITRAIMNRLQIRAIAPNEIDGAPMPAIENAVRPIDRFIGRRRPFRT